MCAVHVGVGQEDRLAVAKLLRIEVVADARPERGDEHPDLFVAEHLVRAGLLDVQDLALERQDRLEPAVAARLRVAAGGDALDDDQLAFLRVALLAVRELARQREAVERALAEDITRFACSLARAESREALFDDALRVPWVLFEVLAEHIVDRCGDLPRDLGVAQPRLGLTL